jgi:hypothetical protein
MKEYNDDRKRRPIRQSPRCSNQLKGHGKYKSGIFWVTKEPWLPGEVTVDLGIRIVKGRLGCYRSKIGANGRTTHIFDTTKTPTHVLVQREFTGRPTAEVELEALLVHSKLSASNGGRHGYIYDVFKLTESEGGNA